MSRRPCPMFPGSLRSRFRRLPQREDLCGIRVCRCVSLTTIISDQHELSNISLVTLGEALHRGNLGILRTYRKTCTPNRLLGSMQARLATDSFHLQSGANQLFFKELHSFKPFNTFCIVVFGDVSYQAESGPLTEFVALWQIPRQIALTRHNLSFHNPAPQPLQALIVLFSFSPLVWLVRLCLHLMHNREPDFLQRRSLCQLGPFIVW